MKNRLLVSALMLAALSLSAHDKMDLNVSLLVENHKAAMADNGFRPAYAPLSIDAASDENVAVVATLAPGADLDALVDAGATIVTRVGDIAVISANVGRFEQIADLDQVKKLSLTYYEPTLYFAREKTNANGVLNGSGAGINQPYSGKGVITGLFDTGIDPNHINFMNADLTENRFKAFYNYTGSNGAQVTVYKTPEDITNFTTDNKNGTHGTHVCGIMAGGFKGKLDFGLNGRKYTDTNNPYYGLCSDSEIIGGAGVFTDANMIAGVAAMVDYAEAAGKPAVINLSIGGLIGPHDGTSAVSRAFEELGKRAIIVVAAGNDGETKCAISRKFGGLNGSMLRTVIKGTSGSMQFWNSTSNRVKFEFCIYSTLSKSIVSSFELPDSRSVFSINEKTTGIGADFAKAFAGGSSIQIQGLVDNNNNRFQVSLVYTLNPGSDATLLPAIRITGNSGETVTGYISGGTFSSNSISGWQDGTTNGSISDMSTGKNIICVGSFTSSKTFTLVDGSAYSLNGEENDQVSAFSSYGTNTATGAGLPDLCGPGCALTSSINSYTTTNYTAAKIYNERTRRENVWAQSSGTSMACPFVAGTVGLMLEANNNLTIDQVREILTSTATPQGSTSNEKLKWGAGKLNVLKAMVKTLETVGVEKVWEDDDLRLIIEANDGEYNVFVAGETALTATLYDLQGRAVASASANADRLTLATDLLTPGVYVVKVDGATSHFTRKLAVR